MSLEKDEMDIIINKLKKENEVLKIKIKSLENIGNQYNIQSNENNKLKGQIENLNIDIKYKENIINNLQQILEQIKFNSTKRKMIDISSLAEKMIEQNKNSHTSNPNHRKTPNLRFPP